MKLFLFTLISVLFVLTVADTNTCTGSRCKRMINIVAKLYNDYGYVDEGNGGGSYNQNRESDCPNCYATDFGNGDYNQNTINIEKK